MPTEAQTAAPHRAQFGLKSLLWLTATLAMALAYLRYRGAERSVVGLEAIGMAVIAGGIIGGLSRRLSDSMFWALLSATYAYLCVTGVPLEHWSMQHAWAAVGAVAGAGIGAVPPNRAWLRMAVGMASAGAVMSIYAVFLFRATGHMIRFDVVTALLVGALLGLLVEVLGWLERHANLPRYISAAVLMLAVIAGNLIPPQMLTIF